MKKFHKAPEFRVRFSETDMAGVVHFSQILRWVENAETDFFRSRGIDFVALENGKLRGFPKKNFSVKLSAPARDDDLIFVEIRPVSTDFGNEFSEKISWEFQIFALRERQKIQIAAGTWTSVFVEADTVAGTFSKLHGVPEEIKNAISEFLVPAGS